MENSILQCNSLVKVFGTTVALKGINLNIPKGKIVGLLGPNGSGKTTLIKLAADLLQPTSGEILLDGKKPGEETKAFVSYLPERLYFSPYMTANECFNFFSDFYKDFDRSKAEEMLKLLNVPLDKKLKKLSKGTKEKVQLALVMSRRAKLYLLDEPIAGVDPATRDYILDTIIKNYSQDATVIISTHLIQDVEEYLDEFIFIKDGNIFAHDTVKAVKENQGKTLDEFFREVFKCLPNC